MMVYIYDVFTEIKLFWIWIWIWKKDVVITDATDVHLILDSFTWSQYGTCAVSQSKYNVNRITKSVLFAVIQPIELTMYSTM